MQHVLVALQYEEASNYSILVKCKLLNFTLWMLPTLDARGRRPPLHAPGEKTTLFQNWCLWRRRPSAYFLTCTFGLLLPA